MPAYVFKYVQYCAAQGATVLLQSNTTNCGVEKSISLSRLINNSTYPISPGLCTFRQFELYTSQVHYDVLT